MGMSDDDVHHELLAIRANLATTRAEISDFLVYFNYVLERYDADTSLRRAITSYTFKNALHNIDLCFKVIDRLDNSLTLEEEK